MSEVLKRSMVVGRMCFFNLLIDHLSCKRGGVISKNKSVGVLYGFGVLQIQGAGVHVAECGVTVCRVLTPNFKRKRSIFVHPHTIPYLVIYWKCTALWCSISDIFLVCSSRKVANLRSIRTLQ